MLSITRCARNCSLWLSLTFSLPIEDKTLSSSHVSIAPRLPRAVFRCFSCIFNVHPLFPPSIRLSLVLSLFFSLSQEQISPPICLHCLCHICNVLQLFLPSLYPRPNPQGQELIPEQEWDQFMSILRQPLPSTFRITGTRHVATAVRECLQQTFFLELSKALQSAGGQGEELAPPTPLPWCVTIGL